MNEIAIRQIVRGEMFRRNYAFFAAIQCKLSVKTVACCQLRKFRVRTKQKLWKLLSLLYLARMGIQI